MEEVGCGTTKHKVCLCITDNIVNSELLTDLANVQLDLHCITDNKPLSLSLSLMQIIGTKETWNLNSFLMLLFSLAKVKAEH